jgi:two-component system sensor histidine kinase VicK
METTKKKLNSADKKTKPINLQETEERIALAAHDLRGVIARISGLHGLLQAKVNEHPDLIVQELTGMIATQCKLGIDITAGIVRAYKQDLCSLNDLLATQIHLYKYQADRKNITLTVDFPDKNVYVHTKTGLLIRILDNLFDNAIKFTTQHGNIKTTLRQEEENKAVISVRDTGIGIPENIQHQLFEKHWQTQRPGTENEASTGLGLYISKQIIEELKGEIWFDSIENVGTTFYISLDTHNNGL